MGNVDESADALDRMIGLIRRAERGEWISLDDLGRQKRDADLAGLDVLEGADRGAWAVLSHAGLLGRADYARALLVARERAVSQETLTDAAPF